MRTLALDFGPARTGVAVSDETGTIARPLTVVADAESAAGLKSIAALARYLCREALVVDGHRHREEIAQTAREGARALRLFPFAGVE